jgi:hypothetical protein
MKSPINSLEERERGFSREDDRLPFLPKGLIFFLERSREW